MNRRQTSRYEDAFHVVVIPEDGDKDGFLCELHDISIGGMAIHPFDDVKFTVNTTVFVEIPLGRSISRIHTRCLVLHASEQMVNLRFVDESEFFHRTLAESIEVWYGRKGEF